MNRMGGSPEPWKAAAQLSLGLVSCSLLLAPQFLAGQEAFPRAVEPRAVLTEVGAILTTGIQDGSAPNYVKAALIGAGIGAGAGFAAYEIAQRAIDLCDASEPTCKHSPSRAQSTVGGALLGSLAGLLIAHIRSDEAQSSRFRISSSSLRGVSAWAFSFRL